MPSRETLWIGSGLAKADVSDDEIIHPLASGAEAYLHLPVSDSVSFQLPGGQRIEIKGCALSAPAEWNVAIGSHSRCGQRPSVHRRMAQEMDIMALS